MRCAGPDVPARTAHRHGPLGRELTSNARSWHERHLFLSELEAPLALLDPPTFAIDGALSETPNVTPGAPLGLPKDAITVRVHDGQTVTTPGPMWTTPAGPSEVISSSKLRPTKKRSGWLHRFRRPAKVERSGYAPLGSTGKKAD
jgi:hypothetical protein